MFPVGKINLSKVFAPPRPSGGPDPQPKDNNERMLGTVAHLLPLIGPLLPPHLWLLAILPPLIFWEVKRGQSAYLGAVGKEVLNFQLHVAGVLTLASMLGFIPLLGIIFTLAVTLAGVIALVLMLMAAVECRQGKFFRYPWIQRPVKK
jgi:uncharacterized Tic20 family protein